MARRLTKSGSKGLMRDQTFVVRVRYIAELLIFKEPVCVLLVVLKMTHAFFNLGGCLCDRLSHFLTDEAGVVRLVFLKDTVEGVKFIIAFLHLSGTFSVVESVALITSFNYVLKLIFIDGLEGPMQLVILWIERTENGAHTLLSEVWLFD